MRISNFNKFNESNELIMSFGDSETIFSGFDASEEDKQFLEDNDGRVKLSFIGFAGEWEESVNYDKSYAYIENGKLYVVVFGLPSNLNKDSVKKYFEKTLEHYINSEYGEFFETEPGCPICMKVKRNGKISIV